MNLTLFFNDFDPDDESLKYSEVLGFNNLGVQVCILIKHLPLSNFKWNLFVFS